MLDKVQDAIDLVVSPNACGHLPWWDLGINDAQLRQALHARGILTVGIPTSVEPINRRRASKRSAISSTRRGYTASGRRIKFIWPAPVATAAQWSRHIATLMTRGADQVRYKGLRRRDPDGHGRDAHNGAVLVRVVSNVCPNGDKSSPIAWLETL